MNFINLNKNLTRLMTKLLNRKKQRDTISLFDAILDEDNNPFKNINIEDIWIENDLFDDKQAVKNVSKEIIDISNPINDIPILQRQ